MVNHTGEAALWCSCWASTDLFALYEVAAVRSGFSYHDSERHDAELKEVNLTTTR